MKEKRQGKENVQEGQNDCKNKLLITGWEVPKNYTEGLTGRCQSYTAMLAVVNALGCK